MTVAVIYDFLPHYRLPVFREMSSGSQTRYEFFAAARTLRGRIEAITPDQLPGFTPIGSWYAVERVLLQPAVLWLPFRRDIDTLIFLANPYFLTTWVAAIVARLLGKRVLFWTHGWLRSDEKAKGRLRNAFYRLANALLLYGNRAKNIGESHGFARSRMYVIYNSLDFDAQVLARSSATDAELAEIRNGLFPGSQAPMVVCSARLTAECRFDQLIDALALLSRDGVQVNALLIGDGPERDNLERLSRKQGVNLVCMGSCYDEHLLSRLVGAAVATVSPGKVGLTAMQSLAFGVPVITHGDLDRQMPEAEAILPGVNGDFFIRDDVQDLARVLRAWIERGEEPQATARRCREALASRYTPAAQMMEIERAVHGEPPSSP